jgi:ABC-type lipoprotein release transport system permease subunit
MLFAVRPQHSAPYVAGVAVMIVTAAVVAIIPELRALRIDPLSALRYE